MTEAAAAEELAKELGIARPSGGGGEEMEQLRTTLAVRQRERKSGFDSLLASIEQRSKGKGKRAKSAPLDDPLDDEAFAALQQKMMNRRR